MNRKRIDFESMRDGILSVSEELDLAIGGRPVNLVSKPSKLRRAVYGYVERQNLPDIFRTFDFANPNIHSPGRPETTVPQQALFALNDPFVIERAKNLARLDQAPIADDVLSKSSPESATRFLFRRILARDPSPKELDSTSTFLGLNPSREKLTDLAQSLLVSNEFFFVD